MKLVFVTQVLDAGDAVLGFVSRWVEGLAKACEGVRVVALEVGDVEGLPDNVDVCELGRRGRLRRWISYRRMLREAFAQDGFDALLAHMVPRYASVGAGLVRGAGGRSFLWYTHKSVDQRLIRAERAVEKVFTASAESMRLTSSKKVVTGHGIDLAHFDARDENPVHPPELLAVGRLTPAKDPLTLVAALGMLVSRGRDLRLELVGGGLAAGDEAYGRSVREQIELAGLQGRVHLRGSVPYRDVPAHYRRATLVLSASRTGSVDKTVLEAMACARPVITCNESFPPLFEELGRDAEQLAFEAGAAEELAQRIETWLERTPAERHALGLRLREIVARDHEVDRLMQRLVAEMEASA